MTLTTLYRFFDAEGNLLYAGITERSAQRWAEHRQQAHWWPQVVTSTVEHFDARPDARAAEKRAIIEELPIYNIAGAPRPPRVAKPEPKATRMAWRCHHCEETITKGGYIWTDLDDRSFASYKRIDSQERHGDGYGQWWIVTHANCDPIGATHFELVELDDMARPRNMMDAADRMGREPWCNDHGHSFRVAARASLDGKPAPKFIQERYQRWVNQQTNATEVAK